MHRSMLIPLAWVTISATPLPFDTPQYFPIQGGSGGSGFTRLCGSGKVMTGVYGREGLLVDAIGVLCRPVSSNGTLGSESTVGSVAGGGGGTSTSKSCPSGSVASGARIRAGTYVNAVTLFCKKWDPATRKFIGALTSSSAGIGYTAGGTNFDQNCEQATQPVNGIRGRAASTVDAIGMICNEP